MKWKRQNETVCMHGTVKCANAEDDAEAQYIVTMHNADIDAMTAENARLKNNLAVSRQQSDKFLEIDLDPNTQMSRAERAEAERDELQRRLDAVVMEHIRTAELKCYCEFDRDHVRTLECEYCEEVATLRAIAEGREG